MARLSGRLECHRFFSSRSSISESTPMTIIAPRAACGTRVNSPVNHRATTPIASPASRPVMGVRAPASKLTVVREKLPVTAKLPDRPLVTLASPRPSNSRLALMRSRRFAAKA